MEDDNFRRLVWDFHGRNRRSFEWREQPEPYRVFVSELMLQQTQTGRVAELFPAFLARFPDFRALADSSLGDMLAAWQGLGYNRRARYLHESANAIVRDWEGILPADEAAMRSLPGIGPNTAASILAFAFNLPTVFIETNIRTVFLHHYHPEAGAPDKALLELVARTLDHVRPREWYYALMDYGVFLKREHGNANRRSPHYARQSRFEGSVRQMRGAILKALVPGSGVSGTDAGKLLTTVRAMVGEAPPNDGLPLEERFATALAGLVADGLVAEQGGRYGLPR